ncbi:unnamed protein product [Closterium sp. NIES-53]
MPTVCCTWFSLATSSPLSPHISLPPFPSPPPFPPPSAPPQGVLAFYKGFIPNFGRLGSWNVIMFLTLEQVKKNFLTEVPDQ